MFRTVIEYFNTNGGLQITANTKKRLQIEIKQNWDIIEKITKYEHNKYTGITTRTIWAACKRKQQRSLF